MQLTFKGTSLWNGQLLTFAGCIQKLLEAWRKASRCWQQYRFGQDFQGRAPCSESSSGSGGWPPCLPSPVVQAANHSPALSLGRESQGGHPRGDNPGAGKGPAGTGVGRSSWQRERRHQGRVTGGTWRGWQRSGQPQGLHDQKSGFIPRAS